MYVLAYLLPRLSKDGAAIQKFQSLPRLVRRDIVTRSKYTEQNNCKMCQVVILRIYMMVSFPVVSSENSPVLGDKEVEF